jgi:thioester reductase-like protein
VHALRRITEAEVVCLVRARDQATAELRLRADLGNVPIHAGPEPGGVRAAAGDQSRPQLGLSDAVHRELSERVDTVYHCAASTSLLADYAELRGANVIGTENVLRFCATRRIKELHYVSTVSVFDFAARRDDAIGEDEASSDWEALRYGYPRSKCIAESLVSKLRQRGLPAFIYRPSAIGGHSARPEELHADIVTTFLAYCLRTGSAPAIERRVDLVPVDYVAAAIAQLSVLDSPRPCNYHLVQPKSYSLTALWEIARPLGYPVTSVPFGTWQARLRDAIRPGEPDAALLGLLASVPAEAFALMPRFDSTRVKTDLAATAVKCPEIDRRLLQLYIASLVQSGRLQTPNVQAQGES